MAEIDRCAKLVPDRSLTSIFFGGGTPSLMDPEVVASILERIKSRWSVSNSLEVTLEANPGSVETSRFQDYAAAGVNRISMGIQALNDTDLRRLGRLHTVSEALAAFDIASSHFNRVSFDLIYARQNQTLSDWKNELKQALTHAADHLSLYQLTIESGTAFGDRYKRGTLKGLPDDNQAFDMYQATTDICADAGLFGYEVSNYAKKGSESLHNLVYWRYGDFIGIGPGAHGRLSRSGQRVATESYSNPEIWISSVENGQVRESISKISQQEQSEEFLMMGLRLSEGIDTQRFFELSGTHLSSKTISHLVDIKMLHSEPNRIRVTNQGRMVLNSVIQAFLTE